MGPIVNGFRQGQDSRSFDLALGLKSRTIPARWSDDDSASGLPMIRAAKVTNFKLQSAIKPASLELKIIIANLISNHLSGPIKP